MSKKKTNWIEVGIGAAILAYGLGNDVTLVGVIDDPILVPLGAGLIAHGFGSL